MGRVNVTVMTVIACLALVMAPVGDAQARGGRNALIGAAIGVAIGLAISKHAHANKNKGTKKSQAKRNGNPSVKDENGVTPQMAAATGTAALASRADHQEEASAAAVSPVISARHADVDNIINELLVRVKLETGTDLDANTVKQSYNTFTDPARHFMPYELDGGLIQVGDAFRTRPVGDFVQQFMVNGRRMCRSADNCDEAARNAVYAMLAASALNASTKVQEADRPRYIAIGLLMAGLYKTNSVNQVFGLYPQFLGFLERSVFDAIREEEYQRFLRKAEWGGQILFGGFAFGVKTVYEVCKNGGCVSNSSGMNSSSSGGHAGYSDCSSYKESCKAYCSSLPTSATGGISRNPRWDCMGRCDQIACIPSSSPDLSRCNNMRTYCKAQCEGERGPVSGELGNPWSDCFSKCDYSSCN